MTATIAAISIVPPSIAVLAFAALFHGLAATLIQRIARVFEGEGVGVELRVDANVVKLVE